MKIHETFQQTVQGEGFWAGTPVDFIRLFGCPVGCSFCDTGYAADNPYPHHVDRDIPSLIAELQSPRVVISGGEPYIHRQLPELVSAVQASDRAVHIETSGAVWREVPENTWITLSPKEHLNPKYPVEPLFWRYASEIKIVIQDGAELAFYDKGLRFAETNHIYLQPEWNSLKESLPITLALLRSHPQYRLSLQTHKFIGVL